MLLSGSKVNEYNAIIICDNTASVVHLVVYLAIIYQANGINGFIINVRGPPLTPSQNNNIV